MLLSACTVDVEPTFTLTFDTITAITHIRPILYAYITDTFLNDPDISIPLNKLLCYFAIPRNVRTMLTPAGISTYGKADKYPVTLSNWKSTSEPLTLDIAENAHSGIYAVSVITAILLSVFASHA